MSKLDFIKPSYDALDSLLATAQAFSYLADSVPCDDPIAPMLRILTKQLSSDVSLVQCEVYRLWPSLSDSADKAITLNN